MPDDTEINIERHEALRTIGQFETFIGLCSCGMPEQFLRQLLLGLNTHPAPAGSPPHVTEQEWSPLTAVEDMMTAYLLDCWELTEHGTSLAGAWLTDDGVRLRDALRLVDLFDGSRDLDSLHSGGRWWKDETVLHPQWRQGARYAELGEWKTAESEPAERSVTNPWVVVTMGSGDCGPDNCPGDVSGPYEGRSAAVVAATRIPKELRPHTLPLSPAWEPAGGASAPAASRDAPGQVASNDR